MIEIFSHSNVSFVHHIKNILENHRFPCIFEETFDSVSMIVRGGRIMLLHEEQLEKAKELIEEVFDEISSESESWTCRTCKNEIEAPFRECWYCACGR